MESGAVHRATSPNGFPRRADIRRGIASTTCLIAVFAACSAEPRSGVTVADSAGVRITLTRDADLTFATIDSPPVLSIGASDVSGPAQFSRIDGVYLDRRGVVWVADGASAELRLFHSDGTHWKKRGGHGEGPGEFRRLRLLGAFQGDSVACWDRALARLTVFDGEGEFARTVPMPPGAEAAPQAHAVFTDGTLLAQFPRVYDAAQLEPGKLLGDTARVERLDLAHMHHQPLASAPGPIWLWTGHSQIPLPFTINPSSAIYGEALDVVFGPDFRVRLYRDGRLTEIYGVERSAREVTRQDIAAYEALMEDAIPEPQRAEYLSVADHPARPHFLPAYSHVVAAENGTVWVRIYSPDMFGPGTWDLFDQQRRWLGQVRTPAGFTVNQVNGDRLVGVWRDTLGVEYVRIYRMRQ